MREEQLNLEQQLAEVMSSERSRTSHGSYRERNAARHVELAPTPALPAGSRARSSSAGPSRLAVPISMEVQQAEPFDVQRQVVHNVYHQTHVENQGVNPGVAALGCCVQQCRSAIARVAEFDETTRLWQCGEASIRAGDGLDEAMEWLSNAIQARK